MAYVNKLGTVELVMPRFVADATKATAIRARERALPALRATDGALLSYSRLGAIEFSIPVFCLGRAYETAKANETLILDQLNNARLFQLANVGSVVQYRQNICDQLVQDIYDVLDGDWEPRERRIGTDTFVIVGQLTLFLTL